MATDWKNDRYWDLDLFEIPKEEHPPMTTDDYRYIIQGIEAMIDDAMKAFGYIADTGYRYRILDKLSTLVSHREWTYREEIDKTREIFIRYLEDCNKMIQQRAR